MLDVRDAECKTRRSSTATGVDPGRPQRFALADLQRCQRSGRVVVLEEGAGVLRDLILGERRLVDGGVVEDALEGALADLAVAEDEVAGLRGVALQIEGFVLV